MGIMPDPGTYNNHCPACFPANESPELLKLFVSGVEKSPHFPGVLDMPPNGYFDLTQTVIPCEWQGDAGGVGIAYWQNRVAETCAAAQTPTGIFGFAKCTVGNCHRWFENGFDNPNVWAFNFGYAFIATPAEVQAMIETVLPMTGPDPRMEVFPMEDNQIVVRYASTRDGTNISLRFDV
ncbi:hypothetical protein ES703_86925 [subsurface metagenome]